MLKGRLKILDTNSRIEKNIFQASEDEIKKIFQKAKIRIHSEIINLVIEALSSCPEIISLQSGKLKYDFGLDFDPTTEIIYAIGNSVQVYFKDFRFTKANVKNVFSVYIQPTDFANILALPSSKVITELGTQLPWLLWLLTQGDAIIITQYSVSYTTDSPSSRSGGAIMKPYGFFKVDSAYSGTREDNFITRALENYQSRISDIIRTNL